MKKKFVTTHDAFRLAGLAGDTPIPNLVRRLKFPPIVKRREVQKQRGPAASGSSARSRRPITTMKTLIALIALALCSGCRTESHAYKNFDGTTTTSTQHYICGGEVSSEYSRK